MNFKSDCDMVSFLTQVKKCNGEVTYQTSEGDLLNLKSLLSAYLFASLSQEKHLIEQGKVVCDNPNDYQLLSDYLETAHD